MTRPEILTKYTRVEFSESENWEATVALTLTSWRRPSTSVFPMFPFLICVVYVISYLQVHEGSSRHTLYKMYEWVSPTFLSCGRDIAICSLWTGLHHCTMREIFALNDYKVEFYEEKSQFSILIRWNSFTELDFLTKFSPYERCQKDLGGHSSSEGSLRKVAWIAKFRSITMRERSELSSIFCYEVLSSAIINHLKRILLAHLGFNPILSRQFDATKIQYSLHMN